MRIHSLIASIIALPVLASAPMGSLDKLPNPRTMPAAKLDITQPKVQRFTLSNGVRVVFMEDHQLPVLNMFAAFKAGSLEDPQGKAGLGRLTGTLLRTGGTRHLTGDQFDEKLADLAADMVFNVDSELSYGAIHCFKTDASEVLSLFSEMLRYPRFASDRFESLRDRTLAQIKQSDENPQSIVGKGVTRMLYNGKGQGNVATVDSVKAITEADLRDFAKTWFVPNNMVIGMSGDLTLAEAKGLLNKAVGDWPKGKLPELARASEPTKADAGIYLHKKEKLTQSVVFAAMKGFREGDSDQVALEAAFQVLGETSLDNRLFNSIRTKHGLAYMAGSASTFAQTVDGRFFGYAITKGESTVKATQLMREECQKLAKDGLTAEEWEKTRKAILNKAVFANATSSQTVGNAIELELFGQPLDTPAKRLEKLQSLTLKEVNEAIQRGFKPEALRFYVLGDPATFGENKLESLGKVHEINS